MDITLRTGFSKLVKYVSTPLHFFSIIEIIIFILIYKSKNIGLPSLSVYILLVIFVGIILFVVACLIYSPKKLQFTAEEQILWRRLELADSKMDKGYLFGEIVPETKPPLLEHKSEEEN